MHKEPVVLSVESVSKQFGDFIALKELSLDVYSGEVLALIGANGAGKSTLLKIMMGALAPTAGGVYFNGRSITHLPMHRRAHLGISMGAQRSQGFAQLTVYDNLLCAVLAKTSKAYHGWRGANTMHSAKQTVAGLLAAFQLDTWCHHLVMTLPYGTRRILELAMAFAGNPSLVILDEPCAGLNHQEAQHMVALIERMRAEKTLLLVEHDMDIVFALANRIAVVDHGVMIACASPSEISLHPGVRAAYLGDMPHA